GVTIAGTVENFVPITDNMLRNPDPEDWLMWRGNYSAWSYSPLEQINPDNVGDLQLEWVWTMHDGASEPAPIVYDGIMYLINPSNIVQALDAATGELIWEAWGGSATRERSEEHTSELQSREKLVCRLLLEKKKILDCL